VTGAPGSNVIVDSSITSTDTGRAVTGAGIPASSFVGAVTNTGPLFPTSSKGAVTTGSFQLVNQAGAPAQPTAPATSITLSAQGDPANLQPGQTPDPLFSATATSPGGGDTGSVLISPSIKPGTVSNTFYNHYSWLRTMEDLFHVAEGHDHAPLVAGTVSGGLDQQGHIGYAAQPGLKVFGSDVFTNAHAATDAVCANCRYGGYPSFLRQGLPSVPTDAVVVGTATEPALTNQGDAVRVEGPTFAALVTVNGPQVPGNGLPYQTPWTTCTWEVTVTPLTGTVPLAVGDFSVLDQGVLSHPQLVTGLPAPPSTLAGGDTATFELRSAEPVADGLLQWAPSGQGTAAAWDFVVEND
jgi:hypothetical protein